MSRILFNKLFGTVPFATAMVGALIAPSAHAALPAPILPNPPHQAVEVNVSPTLTWSRGTIELLANGNFENGDESLAPWQNQVVNGFGGMELDDGTFNPNGTDGPTPPLEGNYSVTLESLNFGGGGFYEFSQLVTIPPGLTDVTFSWSQMVRNYANAFSNTGQFQFFRVEVRNTGGTVLDTLFSTQPGDILFNDLDNIDIEAYLSWEKKTANLTAYSGQTVRIVFVTRTELGNLNVRLDRMSLTARPANPVSNEIFLSLNPIPGVSDLLGSTTANEWPLSNLQANTTYYWRVNGRQGTDFLAGPVWQFRTGPVGAADRFVWTAPSSASAGSLFDVALRAKDAKGNTVTGIDGSANLSAVSLNEATKYHILNNQTFTSFNELEKSTIGYSFTPTSDIWVESLRAFSGSKISLWTSEGFLLASLPLTGAEGTWQEQPLETPISLLAGRSYRIGVFADLLTRHYNRFGASSSFPHGTIDQSFTGNGDAFPMQSHPAQWWLIDFEYVVANPGVLPTTPSTSGTFLNGVWSGSLSLAQASGPIVLLAETESGVKGYSDPIQFGGNSSDTDNDGIPDEWETAEGLNPNDPADADIDTDGDGHTSLQEYLAGTDPNDPNSILRIQSISATDTEVVLEFAAKANKTYSVFYTDAIGQGNWTKLSDVAAQGNDRTESVTDTSPVAGTRFYQVITPAQ